MAKGYKRHATGGSFEQNSFGDLGLREFRRQQSTIIDSLKLQQARSAEYSDQFLKGLKGVDQSEAENRKLLSDLENQVYENKRNAIAKRGQREVVAKLRGTFKSDKRITHDMLLNDPQYIEVTYNPKQHPNRNYFYERVSGKRVDNVAIAIAIATETTESRTRLKTYIKRS